MPNNGERDDASIVPAVIPVGSCLIVPRNRGFDFVRHALAAIDAVHTDGQLPVIPVVQGSRAVGRYVITREGDAARIEAATPPDRRVLSFAHEIGHFLDHQVLGMRGAYASETGGIRALMRAIAGSMSLRTLRGRAQQTHAVITDTRGNRIRFKVNQRDVAYLLEPKEQFARAYAQYISIRSHDGTMLGQLADKRGDSLTQELYCQQWVDEDFAPIAAEFDRLLRRKGWLHE